MKEKVLLLAFTLIGFNSQITLCAQTWVSPIGIPAPPFGINEQAPAVPNPWTTATAGFYYVDNTSAQSTDSQTQNGVTDPSNVTNLETPGKPRKTIPINLPAGSVVEVHGGPYTYSTGGQIKIHANGTAAQPVFIRGYSTISKIKFSKPMYFYGSYGIVENIDLDNWSQGNDSGFEFDNGDHLVLRHSEVHNGPDATTSSVVPGNGTYLVIFDNKIHDNGDWQATYDQDHHGIGGFGGHHVWILDNELYHQSGDGLQINDASAHHIYVGRNKAWENKQSGFWVKYASDVIFSQNVSHDHAESGSSPGQGMGLQYDPIRVWFLFNTSYNNVFGIETGSSDNGGREDIYFIGNRLYNNSQAGIQINNGEGVHCLIGNTIYNNPIGIENGYYNSTISMINNIIAGASNRHILFPDDTQTASRSTIINNLFSSPARIEWGDGNVRNLSSFKTAFPSQCAACIENDPKFVNAAGNDLHLQASSPAINAASSTLINQLVSTYQTLYGVNIAQDFDGVARPQQGAWDLGAYEYLNLTCSSFTVNLGKDTTICAGKSIQLDAGSHKTYLWSDGSKAQKIIVNDDIKTPVWVSVTDSVTGLQCASSDTINITVSALPTVTLSALSSVCVNTPSFALSGGSPAGGTYSGVGVSGNNFNPATAGVKTHTITYTYTNSNGCSNSSSKTITVNALPTLTLSSFSSVCINTPAFALTGGSPSGGTYSGVGVSSNNFNPATAGVKTHTITYTYTNGNGCSNSSSKTITVNALPTLTLSSFSSVCINTPSFALSGGSPSGGTYSGNGVSGNNFNPSTAGVKTHTITYTYTNGNGCSNSSSKTITVNALPTLTLSSFSSVCINTPSFTLSGGSPAGGTYSGVGVSGNNFNPSTAGVGTYTITYTYTNGNGCSSSSSKTITVNALPTVTLSSFSSVCINTPSFALSGGSPSGGTYSGVGVSGNNFNPATAGVKTHTITYTYINGNGCSNSSSKTITVNALPTLTLSSFSSVCINTPAFTLTGGSPTGGTYSGNGVSSNNFNPSTAGVGTYTITYTYTNGSGCSNSSSKTITVNALPTVTLSSQSSVCANIPSFALSGGSPSGGTYSGVGVSGNNFNPSTAGAGTYTITYTYTNGNGCSNSSSKTIIVKALPTVTLSSFSSVCITTPSFALTGGSPAGGTYSGVGVSSNSFNPSTAGVGTYTITYTYTNGNGCSNSSSKTITVDALPTITFSSQSSSVCINTPTFALTGGFPVGGVYSGNGVNGNNFNPSTVGVGTYTITYTYTSSGGCSNSGSKTITVNSIPTVTLSALSSVCVNTPAFALSGGSPAGGVYSGSGVGSNNFNPSVAGVGTYTITYTYTNGCSNSSSKTITVNPLPTVLLSPFTSVCVNMAAFALTGGSPSGGTYSGVGVSNNTFDPAMAGIGSYTITYSYTNNNGCTDLNLQSITVDDCVTGIQNEEDISLLSIYPNPSNGIINLNITASTSHSMLVNVINELSQIVYSNQLNNVSGNYKYSLSLSGQPQGIYFIQVIMNDKVLTKKIIKN